MPFEFVKERVKAQEQKSLYRRRVCVTAQDSRELKVNGKQYLNFCSNDYLGLNHHPEINRAFQQGAEMFGTCASASSLITGFQYAHQALEEEVCHWLNKPRCLLYSSGFAANVGVLHALGQENCHFWLDKLSHASLIDGALASKARVKRFQHNDTEQLANWLSNASSNNQLIITEGVFSMDGDQAEVSALSELAKQHSAWLYLDEAHSLGVVGESGEGLSGKADIVMGTCGKAIATSGAFVACDEALYQYLVNFSRHYIYSTAISPAIAWATKKSIEIIQKDHWRRDKIFELSALFKSKLDSGIKLVPTASSIHAIVVADEDKALDVCKKLREKGIWLTAIRPPTVPVNSSRLRVTITANHNNNDINYLCNCLNEVLA